MLEEQTYYTFGACDNNRVNMVQWMLTKIHITLFNKNMADIIIFILYNIRLCER